MAGNLSRLQQCLPPLLSSVSQSVNQSGFFIVAYVVKTTARSTGAG